ncbi:MAG: MarR family transcriptional regulator [Pseudohongiellaceae bacterium]
MNKNRDQAGSAGDDPIASSDINSVLDTDDIGQVLTAIRRLIRATDLHSRKITRMAGLTSSQLILLKMVRDVAGATIGELATSISLSQATATTILDRLEQEGLVKRERSEQDRRKVFVRLTDEGHAMLERAPEPLQETFIRQFSALKDWERSMILASLQRVAEMMDAQDIDASPLLDVGSLDRNH